MSSQPLDALLSDRSKETSDGPPLADADRVMVERWADFTKALAMYPETNSRVQESRDLFFEAVNSALRGGDRPRQRTTIKLERDRIIVDDASSEITSGTNLFWMYERLDKGALEGVRIQLDAHPDQITAFSQRLLKNFNRKDLRAAPEELWPEVYPGMELLLRKFEGGFHGVDGNGLPKDILSRNEDEKDDEAGGGGTGSGAGDGDGEGDGNEGGRIEAMAFERELSTRLAGEGGVLSRIQGIRKAVDIPDKAKGDKMNVDLVSGVVRMLPVDVMPDFAKVVDLTEAVLDTLNEHVAHEGLSIEAGADDGMSDLKALLFAASRKYFGRHKKEAEAKAKKEERGDGSDVHQTAKRGHKGDDKITDDLDAFMNELSTLPVENHKVLKPKQADLESEQLDVYLTFLTDLQSPEVTRNLYPSLRKLLARPGVDELKVLYSHLQKEWFRADITDGGVGKNRILNLLQDMGATRLLRECGILSEEHMAEAFPQDFGYYVDALDFRNAEDMKELDTVCKMIGETRIREAADVLISNAALLDGERAERLLSHASMSLLPFAKILIDRGGDRFRDLVIGFLQAVKPRKREACLLSIVDNPIFLSSRYLSLITSPVLTDEDDRKLRNEVAEVLCRFIRSSAHVPGQAGKRLEAVRHLAFFPTSRATLMLSELQKAKRFWFFKAESVEIRKAARLGLMTIQRGVVNV